MSDKVSTDVVDQEHQNLMKAGYQGPKSKPASGEKLIKQLDRDAAAARVGAGKTSK